MQKLFVIIFVIFPMLAQAEETLDEKFPEADIIEAIISTEKPEGLVFLVMEYDEEALTWVMPRVLYYTKKLRQKWASLEIIILSHGDEMFALQTEYQDVYPTVHKLIKALRTEYDVNFQVCGSYAHLSDIAESQFPSYIDVVPFAPAEIENYRLMGYKMLHLEHTW